MKGNVLSCIPDSTADHLALSLSASWSQVIIGPSSSDSDFPGMQAEKTLGFRGAGGDNSFPQSIRQMQPKVMDKSLFIQSLPDLYLCAKLKEIKVLSLILKINITGQIFRSLIAL